MNWGRHLPAWRQGAAKLVPEVPISCPRAKLRPLEIPISHRRNDLQRPKKF
jgi:hypothetical protein